MSLGQILGQDLDLAIHGFHEAFHTCGRLLSEDSFNPPGSSYHFLHGIVP